MSPAGSTLHCLWSFLTKQVNPVSDHASRSNYEFSRNSVAEHVRWPYKNTINKFQNVGNSTGQISQFLQQINYKKKREREPVEQNRLERHIS